MHSCLDAHTDQTHLDQATFRGGMSESHTPHHKWGKLVFSQWSSIAGPNRGMLRSSGIEPAAWLKCLVSSLVRSTASTAQAFALGVRRERSERTMEDHDRLRRTEWKRGPPDRRDSTGTVEPRPQEMQSLQNPELELELEATSAVQDPWHRFDAAMQTHAGAMTFG